MPADDFKRPGSDDREGRGVLRGEVSGGVEENEPGEVSQALCYFIRPCRECGGPGVGVRADFHGFQAR